MVQICTLGIVAPHFSIHEPLHSVVAVSFVYTCQQRVASAVPIRIFGRYSHLSILRTGTTQVRIKSA